MTGFEGLNPRDCCPRRRARFRGIVAFAAGGGLCAVVIGLAGDLPADAAGPQCLGADATIVGTPGVDTLRGTDGDDVIVGGGSDGGSDGGTGDTIDGLGGNDKICAPVDATQTIVHGGAGDDQIESAGVLFGGRGDDRLVDPPGDQLFPYLVGGPGADVMISSADDGTHFVPGPGNDSVTATDPRAYNVLAFRGADRGVIADLRTGVATGQGSDHLAGIRIILGTRFNDLFVGNERGNAFGGREGSDLLSGHGANDYLRGGPGTDWIDGGAGGDQLLGGQGSDALHGRHGRDFLVDVRPDPNLVLAGPGRDTCGGGYRVPPSVERGCERRGTPSFERTIERHVLDWHALPAR